MPVDTLTHPTGGVSHVPTAATWPPVTGVHATGELRTTYHIDGQAVSREDYLAAKRMDLIEGRAQTEMSAGGTV